MNPDALAEALVPALEKLIAKHMAGLIQQYVDLESRTATAAEAAEDAVRILLRGDGLKSLIDLQVTEYLTENPPPQGERGEAGEKGLDGKDGAGIADLLVDRDGAMVATFTDGRMKNLGQIIGKDGQDGKDGADYSGLEVSRTYDADTHEVVERWGQKELRYPAGGIHHGGYWREGAQVKAAQTWTHAGVAWIAKRDTTQKPDRNSEDWEIFASKGRDGKDLRDAPEREPIKVGHG